MEARTGRQLGHGIAGERGNAKIEKIKDRGRERAQRRIGDQREMKDKNVGYFESGLSLF